MKGVILAAGLGTRLRPITNNQPKCMVSVNGVTIIDKQISNLHEFGVTDIVVVGGYKADILKEHLSIYDGITFVDNIRYAETNNMYSLYMAYQHVNLDEFILMNADVYYDSAIIGGLLDVENTDKSMIACDLSGYIDESMKITLNPHGIIDSISKTIPIDRYYAVSIDVYKLNRIASSFLFDEIKNTVEVNRNENSWTEVALDSILKKISFYPYVIEGRWFEIDNHDDLSKAEKLFNKD